MATSDGTTTAAGMAALTEQITRASRGPDFGPAQVQALLTTALSAGADWLEDAYAQRPDDRDWVLRPTYRAADGRCSVLVAVFRPGVQAPVHDHRSWAVIGICRGREHETWFRRPEDVEGPLQVVAAFTNETGTAHVVPDGVIHTVEALDDRDAVSIHVYGTDIVTQERSTYDRQTGAVVPYRPDFSSATPAQVGGTPALRAR
jgi:predicted metal-dependent enzyme (double-stranded beta helix superfamily)